MDFEKLILPEIEKIADRFPNEIINIGRLKLDLGEISSAEIAEKVATLLETAILMASDPGSKYNDGDRIKLSPPVPDKEKKLEALLFWLNYGYSSPSFTKHDTTNPADWAKKIISSREEGSITKLFEFLTGNQSPSPNRKQALYRLLQVLPADGKRDLLEMFLARSDNPLKELARRVLHQITAVQISGFLSKKIYNNLLDTLFFQVAILNEAAKISELNVLLENLATVVPAGNSSTKQTVAKKRQMVKETSVSEQEVLVLDYLSKTPSLLVEMKNENYFNPSYYKAGDVFDEKERLLIANAGLVLIAPFLPRFFENAGLTTNNSFISERHRMRGLLLLQKIAEPSQKFYEGVLPLNKLLCGIPLPAPVDINQKLTKRENQEISELLISVISNWPALKNTTPAGFREAFLKRKGTVEKNNADYLVRVEALSHDILMSTLPWNITLIKCPWNDYMIHVEWFIH